MTTFTHLMKGIGNLVKGIDNFDVEVHNLMKGIDNLDVEVHNLMKGINNLDVEVVNLMKGINNLDVEVVNLMKGIVDLVKGVADLDDEVQLPFIPRRYQAVSIHREGRDSADQNTEDLTLLALD